MCTPWSNFFPFHPVFSKILSNFRFCPKLRGWRPRLGNSGSTNDRCTFQRLVNGAIICTQEVTKLLTTRMHSSRMCTARSSSRRGEISTRTPGTRPPSPGPGTPPVDRHTPVNILPCPKLRLRAVKIKHSNRMCIACLTTVRVLVATTMCQYGWGQAFQGGRYPRYSPTPLDCLPLSPVDRMTDAYENITFPQLLLRVVIIRNWSWQLENRLCCPR